MNKFYIGDTVQGKVAGIFVIIDFVKIKGEDEQYAQLQPLDRNLKMLPGSIALPISKIEHYKG